MNERAYYNENDEFAAAWLRNVIAQGLIAPGDVDTRSIVDVRPDDIRRGGYSQCHFFAGIGVWSYALRSAGWPDARHVWTGSCPCGPFSQAGKGEGFSDARHLWPEFDRLIAECRPRLVLGEQVASPDGLAWLDLVQADLERKNYAVGAVDLCAAGVGAPHIRQRLYWMANANRDGCDQEGRYLASSGRDGFVRDGTSGVMVHGERARLEGYAGNVDGASGRTIADRSIAATGSARGVDDSLRDGRQARRCDNAHHDRIVSRATGGNAPAGPVNGLWRDADWLLCRDGKWRPVEPGTFPLAHGTAARVGRLRGYGNAIVAPLAQAFIEAVMEVMP